MSVGKGDAQRAEEERNQKVQSAVLQEEPVKPRSSEETKGTAKRPVPGSISFVPGTAGLMIAGAVVRDLLKQPEK